MQNDNMKYVFLQMYVMLRKKCQNAGQLTLNFLALTVGLSLKAFGRHPPTI